MPSTASHCHRIRIGNVNSDDSAAVVPLGEPLLEEKRRPSMSRRVVKFSCHPVAKFSPLGALTGLVLALVLFVFGVGPILLEPDDEKLGASGAASGGSGGDDASATTLMIAGGSHGKGEQVEQVIIAVRRIVIVIESVYFLAVLWRLFLQSMHCDPRKDAVTIAVFRFGLYFCLAFNFVQLAAWSAIVSFSLAFPLTENLCYYLINLLCYCLINLVIIARLDFSKTGGGGTQRRGGAVSKDGSSFSNDDDDEEEEGIILL